VRTSAGAPRSPSRPVFVDRSGTRHRRLVVLGAGLATALVTGLVILIVGFLGTPTGHVPGFPGAGGAGRSTAPSPAVTKAATVTTQRATTEPRPTTTPPTSPSPSARRHYPSHPAKPSKSK
jgi:hypothetical protein